jgi:hypothetical protein
VAYDGASTRTIHESLPPASRCPAATPARGPARTPPAPPPPSRPPRPARPARSASAAWPPRRTARPGCTDTQTKPTRHVIDTQFTGARAKAWCLLIHAEASASLPLSQTCIVYPRVLSRMASYHVEYSRAISGAPPPYQGDGEAAARRRDAAARRQVGSSTPPLLTWTKPFSSMKPPTNISHNVRW